jgi:MFS family permease
LVLVIGAVVFVDTMFYAAIVPLLPTLAHQFHLSKLSAGVMTAAYPAGTLVGSLPGGILAARVGPKRTVYVGILLLAGSTLAFGFLENAVLLTVARFIEGVGGACSWAGGLAWLVSETPARRRGQVIGSALGTAVAGALFGPVVGTIADAIGRAAAFSGVVALSLVLIDQARRLPVTHAPSGQGLRAVGGAIRDSRLLAGMWLVTLGALASGAINVLGPLRLHGLGAVAAVIGAIYLVGAAFEGSLSPLAGRMSDRRGRLRPLTLGLAVPIPLLLGFTLPNSVALLGLLIVGVSGSLAGLWTPAMAMLSDAAEHRALDQGLAAALINVAWAGGQIVGSTAGGGLARVSGDALPMTLTAGLFAATLVWLLSARRMIH